MAVIRNLVVKIAADISSLSKGLQSAQKSIQKVSATFTKAGTALTASITAPLVALGGKAVSVSQDFEQSMANAASVAGASAEEFDKMKSIAREMGSKTVFSASQAADALYYMASAGYKVNQMADAVEAMLNLASATQSDLAFTTDVVISTLNQFGLEANQAERVANVFAAAIGNSMATMDKLSNSMSYVGPVANSLGYSIEDVTASLSVLYDAGYDGSQAGTTLRQALVSLMNPSSAALGIFKELGLTYDEVNPATNDFATILDRLSESGMDTAQAMKVFGARGGPGMLAMMSASGDAVRDMTDAITGTNKATEMAATQLDTLQGQWKILKSELEEIAIMFGDVLIPIIRQLINKYISPLTKKIMGLSMGTRKQIVSIALMAATIGPLLLVLLKVIGSLGTILKVGRLLFSKVGLIIAILAILVLVIKRMWDTNEDFRKAVTKIWDKVKTAIVGAMQAIKKWWDENGQKLIDGIVETVLWLWRVIEPILEILWDVIKSVLTVIKQMVLDILKAIKAFWEKYGEKIKQSVLNAITAIKEWWDTKGKALLDSVISILSKIWEFTKQILSKVWQVTTKLIGIIQDIVVDAISFIQEFWEEHGEQIMNTVGKVFNTILNIVQTVFNIVSDALMKFFDYIKPIWEKLKKLFLSLWDTLVELYELLKPVFDLIGGIVLTLLSIVTGVLNGIISALGPFIELVINVANAIMEIIQAVCAILRGDWSDAWEHMKNFAGSIWASIQNLFLGIWGFIKGFGEGIVSFFDGIGINIGDIFKRVWEGIKNFFSNLFGGVKEMCSNTWGAITNLFGNVGNYFVGLFKDGFNWGKNLISNISDGIKNTWNKVVDGVKSVGKSIKDFLGFGSPTKKGPGHTADEWIPNLMNMMEEDMYDNIPMLQRAAASVADSLNFTNTNQAMVSSGSNPNGELVNGLLQGLTAINGMGGEESRDVVLEIDGQRFARFMLPKITKEYKKNGIILKEV